MLVFGLLLHFSVTAQTNLSQQYLKDYQTVVPSPNVASLLAPSRQSVNGYSGQTEIKIDIFTIQGNGFQIPVSLSYSTSGFNVNETPSWVGAGWALQGTGVIGRTIRDMPDNSAYGYFSESMDYYYRGDGRPNIDSLLAHCPSMTTRLQINSLTSNTTQQNPSDPANYYLPLDSEPDLYQYTLPTGLSGQFVFNRNKELIQLSPNGSFIDPVGNFITNFFFTIKDAAGNLYYFNNDLANEKVKVNTLCDNLAGGSLMHTPEISAWNLISIQSAVSSEAASFSYTDETLVYQTNVSKTNMVKLNAFGMAEFLSDPEDKTCYSEQTAYTKRPNTISSNGYVVRFIADTEERIDLTGGHRLKKILVEFQGELIKSFELFHSYFKDDQFLRLDSIVEISGNQRMPAYKFTYDDQEPFPSKGSFDQDHWGYFNNAGNTDFTTEVWLRDFPLSYVDTNYSITHITRYIPGANREPDPVYSTKGMLTHVRYPTGGSTEFLYELNSYSNFPTDYESTKRQYSPTGAPSSVGRFTIVGTKFTSNAENYNYIRIKDIETCEPEGEGGGLEACAFVNLHNLNTNEWYTLTRASKNALLKVSPGNYEMIMGTSPEYGRAYAELEWFNYTNQFATERKGGGLRIKQINYKDNNDEILESKRWNYWNADSTSSGYLHSTPYIYVEQSPSPILGMNPSNPITQLYRSGTYRHTVELEGGGTGFGGCSDSDYIAEFLAINSDLKYPMQKFSGSWVGYDRIEEIQSKPIRTEINGRLVTSYYTKKLANLDNYEPAAPAKRNYNNVNGKVLKEEVYAISEAGENKISETVYDYKFEESDTIWGFVVGKKVITGCPTCDFEYSIYSENVYTAQLESVFKTSFNDLNALTSTTAMSYIKYNDTYFTKSESKVLSSLNPTLPDTLKTIHFYPFEMDPEKSQAFKNRNFIQDPFASLLIKSGRLIDGIYKSYSTDSHILLDSVLSLYNPNGTILSDPSQIINNPSLYFQTKAKIRYKSNGLQSSITTYTGQTTNYLWGSYNEVPVATIVDTGIGAYFFDSFEEALYSNNNINPRTGRYYAVLPKSLSFTPIAAGEYTLTYYYRSNSNQPWEFKQRLINYPAQTFNIEETSGHIDEVRITPLQAQMTSYTYLPGLGITSVNDPNNKFILFNYDEFGRLKSKADADGNMIQQYQYHYKGQSND